MNTLEAIRTKCSVREFKDEPVPQAVIEQIITAGRRAQSSQNHQPWTFVIVRDRAKLEALSACGDGAGHVAGAAFAIVIVDAANWSFDIGQAAAYLQLAAWDLGVASCLAYFGEADKVKALLGVPPEMTIEMGLSFGYAAQAAGRLNRSGRKPLAEVTRWETW